jgi:hypothetical protein
MLKMLSLMPAIDPRTLEETLRSSRIWALAATTRQVNSSLIGWL